MARFWVRNQSTSTLTSATTLAINISIYQNSRETVNNITLVQKATVVAGYLFGVTTTDDTWSLTLLVVEEQFTPTYGDPELSDEQVKGQFIFARGPVLYQPRRLIAIPSESEFMLRVSKEQGGNTATFNWHAGFLINTSL